MTALLLTLALIAQEPGRPKIFDTVTSSAAEAPQCLPGATFQCACPEGRTGTQTCNRDGASLGPCRCPKVRTRRPREVYDYGPDPRDPRYLPHEEDMPIPDGYVPTTRIRTGWLIAGLATFGGLYFLTGLSGSEDDVVRFIPGVGPLILAADSDTDQGLDFVLVVDGLVQIAAVAVAIWAVTDRRKLLVREDLAVTPFLSPDGGGLSVSSRF